MFVCFVFNVTQNNESSESKARVHLKYTEFEIRLEEAEINLPLLDFHNFSVRNTRHSIKQTVVCSFRWQEIFHGVQRMKAVLARSTQPPPHSAPSHVTVFFPPPPPPPSRTTAQTTSSARSDPSPTFSLVFLETSAQSPLSWGLQISPT